MQQRLQINAQNCIHCKTLVFFFQKLFSGAKYERENWGCIIVLGYIIDKWGYIIDKFLFSSCSLLVLGEIEHCFLILFFREWRQLASIFPSYLILILVHVLNFKLYFHPSNIIIWWNFLL